MPLYYLNTQFSEKEFFTDAGTIREALILAGSSKLVRLIAYSGQIEFSEEKQSIKNGLASEKLQPLLNWLPADIILSKLYEMQLFTCTFMLEFSSGIIVEGNCNREIIVTFPNEDSLYSILDTFRVPWFFRETLIANPGFLYLVNTRSELSRNDGYFKSIRIFLDQLIYESVLREVNLNMN